MICFYFSKQSFELSKNQASLAPLGITDQSYLTVSNSSSERSRSKSSAKCGHRHKAKTSSLLPIDNNSSHQPANDTSDAVIYVTSGETIGAERTSEEHSSGNTIDSTHSLTDDAEHNVSIEPTQPKVNNLKGVSAVNGSFEESRLDFYVSQRFVYKLISVLQLLITSEFFLF